MRKKCAVQASEFFQDWEMVKELCELLSAHLFNTAPEAGVSSRTKQHIAEVRRALHTIECTRWVGGGATPLRYSMAPALSNLCLQVLEGLSGNLVMDILRSAPGSLQEQLPRLPESLASHAALAHIPSLAATCSPAPERADQGASED